jgi:hypothetical protein
MPSAIAKMTDQHALKLFGDWLRRALRPSNLDQWVTGGIIHVRANDIDHDT